MTCRLAYARRVAVRGNSVRAQRWGLNGFAVRRPACSHARRCMPDSSSDSSDSIGRMPSSPVADALIKSMQDLASKMSDKPQSTNLVLGTEGSETAWRTLDEKVNKYPLQRSFKAIGTGGDEFRTAMVAAVENVVGRVHVECISERESSGGKYQAVTIGPVWVENADQVVKVYSLMRRDARLKWYI